MPLWLRIARVWIPLAVAVTALVALAYVGVQQSYRLGANDPQTQLAEDGAARLATGATPQSVAGSSTVDAARSLAPFVIVVGADNAVLATSASLDGNAFRPPAGVLDAARAKGTNTVTWQPRRGVRIASVSVATSDGRVVVAGRSLRAAEQRIEGFGKLALAAWLATLAAMLVVTWLVELMAGSLGGGSR